MYLLPLLLPFLFLSNAQAGLEEFRSRFAHYASFTSPYEFAIAPRRQDKEVLRAVATTPGLESMSFKKLILKKEIGEFIKSIFARPHMAPYFCHNLVDRALTFNDYRALCLERVSYLFKSLEDDDLEISVYHYEGNNLDKGDFQKAKLLAFDAGSAESVELSMDIEVQNSRP